MLNVERGDLQRELQHRVGARDAAHDAPLVALSRRSRSVMKRDVASWVEILGPLRIIAFSVGG